MSKKARLIQLSDAIKALTQEVSDLVGEASRLFDEGRVDEAREGFEAGRELVKVVKNAQVVVRTIYESDVDDPLLIRELVQDLAAREDLGLQPLLEKLAEQDPWWSERST